MLFRYRRCKVCRRFLDEEDAELRLSDGQTVTQLLGAKMFDMMVFDCGHSFHKKCVVQEVNPRKKIFCPTCNYGAYEFDERGASKMVRNRVTKDRGAKAQGPKDICREQPEQKRNVNVLNRIVVFNEKLSFFDKLQNMEQMTVQDF